MVLLAATLLSLSALSAVEDTSNSTVNGDTINPTIVDNSQAKSIANIESNSIEKKVSNEYETITNVNSSSSNKTLTKQSTENTDTKTATTTKQSIKIKSNSITTYAGSTIKFTANVTKENGEKVKYAKVAIKINGNTVVKTTVANGSFSEKYTIPAWSAKKYNLTIIVGETSTTATATKNLDLVIKKQDLKVVVSDYKVASASKVKLNATVRYSNGTLANGLKAVFKVNGKTVVSGTVTKGVFSGTYIVPASAGNYTLVLKVGESKFSNNKTITKNLQVVKKTPSIKKDILFFAKAGNTVTLKAVFGNTGYANASGKVAFKIDNKTVATVKIVNNTASYKYSTANLKAGIHKVYIVYGGSSALNSVRTNAYLRVQKDLVSSFTYEQVLEKANSTHEFVLKNKRLPNFVTINGNQVSMNDLLYMFAQALSYNNSYHNGGFTAPTNQYNTNFGAEIRLNNYTALSKSIVNSYISNGRAPNAIKTSSGVKLSFNDTIYTLAKALSFTKNNKRLPNYVTVVKINPSSTSSGEVSTGVNNKVPAGFEKYVQKAENAGVNSSLIRSAVKSAVSGVSGVYNQAVAIFNYVRDKTSYSYYLNTQKGAEKTLTVGSGNCVDQAHLLLGMYRTASIPARYCHATCYFRSGLVVGHVWVEVYANGKWYKCDTTSNQNSFNNIVNWNKSSTVYRYTDEQLVV